MKWLSIRQNGVPCLGKNAGESVTIRPKQHRKQLSEKYGMSDGKKFKEKMIFKHQPSGEKKN